HRTFVTSRRARAGRRGVGVHRGLHGRRAGGSRGCEEPDPTLRRGSDRERRGSVSDPVGRFRGVAPADAVGLPPLDGAPAVLVVDDDAGARAVVARAVAGEGFATVEAATGRAALALVRARPVDVVVLDLGLPDLDGFGLLRELGRATRASTIVVSGDAR